jgi:hypothetical protein
MTPTRHLYLAGPMAGLPGFNVPAFAHAAERLRSVGYFVANPGEMNHGPGVDLARPETFTAEHRQRAMLNGLRDLIGYEHWAADGYDDGTAQADGVALLDGWAESRGAVLEVAVANAIGLRVEHWTRWLSDGLAGRP